MPSGSHGGSGGSHFGGGGGSRSSRGSHFGGSRGSSRRYYNGHRVYVFGSRNYYVGNGKSALFNTLKSFAIIFFVCTVLAAIFMGSNISQMNTIKNDYNYYQEMIERAHIDNSYIKQARVVDMQYNFDAEKYYIIYKIDYQEYVGGTPVNKVLEGYSYSVYSQSEAFDLLNRTISVAVNTNPVTADTDSMPMDYENTQLEDDGEYLNAKSGRKVSTIFLVVLGSLTIVLIVGSVVTFKKSLTLVDDAQNISPAKAVQETIDSSIWTCKYCGGKNTDKTKCTNCNAPRQ